MHAKSITITKNRGWRGLAEAKLLTDTGEPILKMVFSFSQQVWNTMLRGKMVFEDKDNYYVVNFHNADTLPKGQRSVLIKDFKADISKIDPFTKSSLTGRMVPVEIYYHKHNSNAHTTSAWNNIGIRVIPRI